MTKPSHTIAVFDFDGTITTKDTLFDFVSFYHGKGRLLIGLVAISPSLVAYKLGFISNEKAKQRMFSFFFKGESEVTFVEKCKKYASRISEILRDEAINKMKWHQNAEHDVIIVSASIDKWIQPWASSLGIETVVGTQIEIEDGHITGCFSSRNCYGPEKVERLHALYSDKDSYQLYAYGDSNGDKELLSIADHPFYRKF